MFILIQLYSTKLCILSKNKHNKRELKKYFKLRKSIEQLQESLKELDYNLDIGLFEYTDLMLIGFDHEEQRKINGEFADFQIDEFVNRLSEYLDNEVSYKEFIKLTGYIISRVEVKQVA